MGDEMKQCLDKDRFDRYEKDPCNCRSDDCIGHERSDDWGLGDWLPIIIIVFLLCGGSNIFGGGDKDDCCDNNGFGGSWLLILIVIFLFLGNQRDGKGGFLGGLFG
ncbi:MAG: hypothetical protein PHC91_10050 [Eubacteriales bacterium]|nr:hypothetical protein [Eubacteriales bacterium]